MKFILFIFLALFLIANVNAATCNTATDKDVYNYNNDIYVSGNGFSPNTNCDWQVKRLPDDTVTSGDVVSDENGNINQFLSYTTVSEDLHNQFQANINCNECSADKDFIVLPIEVEPSLIPEFSTVAAVIALMGSLAIFAFVRRKY